MTGEPTTMPHRYQRWHGAMNQGQWTWLAIVVSGVRLGLKSMRTRAMLMSVSGVVLAGGVVLYLLSLLEVLAGTQEAAGIVQIVKGLLKVDIGGVTRIGEFREILWRILFLLLIKMEMVWVLVVVSTVGPGLIANDLKHRALPIYFAKPVTPLTYLMGKWLIVAAFIAVVTLVPNLLSLSLGVLITDGLHTWGQVFGLGVDLVLSGLMVCLAGGAIVLALSSLTSDPRYATVAWLAVCLLPVTAQGIIYDALPAESTTGWLGCLSLRDNVLTLTDWLFSTRDALAASGLPGEAFTHALVRPVRAASAAVVLAGWTVGGLLVSYRRVVTFSRSAANL